MLVRGRHEIRRPRQHKSRMPTNIDLWTLHARSGALKEQRNVLLCGRWHVNGVGVACRTLSWLPGIFASAGVRCQGSVRVKASMANLHESRPCKYPYFCQPAPPELISTLRCTSVSNSHPSLLSQEQFVPLDREMPKTIQELVTTRPQTQLRACTATDVVLEEQTRTWHPGEREEGMWAAACCCVTENSINR